jgi:hypothetical protein
VKRNGSLYVVVVFAAIAGYFTYQWWYNPTRAVQRRLGELATALSAGDHESDMSRIARLAELRRYFSTDVRIRAGSSGPELASRDALMGLIAGWTPPPDGWNVQFVDVQVTMESDDAARAYMTVEVNAHDAQSGQPTLDTRDASVNLAKREGEWVVTNGETRETPEKPAEKPVPPRP